MISLTLLHPLKDTPIQHWEFKEESVVRIGRSTDNHVILYSAVVSRHHVELRCEESSWEVVNLGTNGTYLDGTRIEKMPLTHEAVIRLARSGPKIQIRIDSGQDGSLSPSPDILDLPTKIDEGLSTTKPMANKFTTAIDP
ncbi:FHA domain-containing protein [Roseofilum casamattae]|uniref:FHA domain-containing protein n=1 Tax=Roseofilum casamattae BLCC-M143 TaxID=3022442 RepID=A0ABT7BTZ4_9CYAN|nr:FHA domain-containing protein [Roseofilum casamattae]MDJ1182650.1 FHA domain-containing protein [Roseofilum casamattae BLCC-M143]